MFYNPSFNTRINLILNPSLTYFMSKILYFKENMFILLFNTICIDCKLAIQLLLLFKLCKISRKCSLKNQLIGSNFVEGVFWCHNELKQRRT